jgi:hypothetical protein
VGYFETKGDISNSGALGDISIFNKGAAKMYVGGLIGYICGTGAGLVTMENCAYEGGLIKVTKTNPSASVTGESYTIGGVLGNSEQRGEFTRCHSRARGIEVKVNATYGKISLGGFAGIAKAITIADCDNTSPIRLNEGVADSELGGENIVMGGFAGTIARSGATNTASLTRCWSSGSVSSRSKNIQFTGGLIGFSSGGSSTSNKNTVIQSYATGNVSAENISPTSVHFVTGGLAGYFDNYCDIKESYATGSVYAMSQNGHVSAGGLAGQLNTGTVENSYAVGNVAAESRSSATVPVYAGGLVRLGGPSTVINHCFASGAVMGRAAGSGSLYAGGLVGHMEGGGVTSLSNNAALGPSVTATGGGSRNAGRVYGNKVSGSASALYALKPMLLEEDAAYDTLTPTVVTASPDVNGPDGADAAASAFRTSSFWTGTLGFTAASWNFAGLARGYPYLSWQ